MTRAVGLSTFNVRYKLNCISLWLCVVYLGLDQITARLQYYMTLVSNSSSLSSANLSLLVGRQEENPACKKTE